MYIYIYIYKLTIIIHDELILIYRRDLAYGVAAHGLLHLEARGPQQASGPGEATSAALAEVAALVRDAGGRGLADLAECTVFAQDAEAPVFVTPFAGKRGPFVRTLFVLTLHGMLNY